MARSAALLLAAALAAAALAVATAAPAHINARRGLKQDPAAAATVAPAGVGPTDPAANPAAAVAQPPVAAAVTPVPTAVAPATPDPAAAAAAAAVPSPSPAAPAATPIPAPDAAAAAAAAAAPSPSPPADPATVTATAVPTEPRVEAAATEVRRQRFGSDAFWGAQLTAGGGAGAAAIHAVMLQHSAPSCVRLTRLPAVPVPQPTKPCERQRDCCWSGAGCEIAVGRGARLQLGHCRLLLPALLRLLLCVPEHAAAAARCSPCCSVPQWRHLPAVPAARWRRHAGDALPFPFALALAGGAHPHTRAAGPCAGAGAGAGARPLPQPLSQPLPQPLSQPLS